MKFSNRVDLSAPNAIALAEQKASAKGRLIKLADSNPTRHGLGVRSLPEYRAEPRGPRAAREALAAFIASRDERRVDPDRLYLLSSTSQAYAWLIKLFCDPGDRILAPTPGYPLVEELARLEAVEVDYYPLTWVGTRWEMSVTGGLNLFGVETEGNVAKRVRPNGIASDNSATPWGQTLSATLRYADEVRPHGSADTPRALIAINPNNPTGSYLNPEEYKEFVDFAANANIPIIADEVFFQFELGEKMSQKARPHDSFAGESRVLTFTLDGLSKNLAAPGVKVAWIEVSGPDELVNEAQKRLDIIADGYLPFSDALAEKLPDWLSAISDQTQRTRERCLENLQSLAELVSQEPTGTISILTPEGGWNALLRFPAHVDEDELLTGLIRDSGITAQPGYFFDMPFRGVVSVSLLLEPEIFRAATAKLLAAVSRLI